MYKLQLKALRKKAGFKTQKEIADFLGIKERKYSSWEREEVALTLENAYMIARALNCTPNDLCGWSKDKNENGTLESSYEQELIECFRQSTKQRKANILQTARDAAGMSKYIAQRDESLPKSG